jgi:hypothetical protein
MISVFIFVTPIAIMMTVSFHVPLLLERVLEHEQLALHLRGPQLDPDLSGTAFARNSTAAKEVGDEGAGVRWRRRSDLDCRRWPRRPGVVSVTSAPGRRRSDGRDSGDRASSECTGSRRLAEPNDAGGATSQRKRQPDH